MKKLLVVAMLAAFAAAPAFAADVYTYEGKGVVTFNHKGHADKLGCEAGKLIPGKPLGRPAGFYI